MREVNILRNKKCHIKKGDSIWCDANGCAFFVEGCTPDFGDCAFTLMGKAASRKLYEIVDLSK